MSSSQTATASSTLPITIAATTTAKLSFPHEVWIHIAHYIPPLELEELFSVNSTLFHLAMEQRYRQISFSYLSRRMLRLLMRLKDPEVAKRVRILHMHPHFVKEVIESQSPSPAASDSRLSTLFSKHSKKLFNRPKSRKSRPRAQTLGEIVMLMNDVLSALPSLQEYRIAWVGLPIMPTPFITTPFRSSHVTKLCLEISLENLATLFYFEPQCSMGLKELDLFLRTDHTLDNAGYDMILANILAPLINKYDLESLTLRLWEPLDTSPLFAALRRLPSLSTFSLTIPLTSPHLGDPNMFADFVNLHSATITTIRIRASDLSSPVLGLLDGQSLSRWIESAFYAVRVDALRNFELGMALVPYESALLCLSRFRGQLERLTLTGRPLSYEEVAGLLENVQCLGQLRVGPVVLSPEMMDVFAESGVQRLELVVMGVVPAHDDPLLHSPGGLSEDEAQVARFVDVMEGRIYEEWALKKLELVLLSSSSRSMGEEEMKRVWRMCVPGLETICT